MKTIPLLILTILIWSCKDRTETVVNPRDYDDYLTFYTNASSDASTEEIRFWLERLNQNSHDEVAVLKLAGLYSARFKISGEISDLEVSDSLYHSVLKTKPAGSVEIYHSLATNAVTQHRFQAAKEYVKKAIELNDKRAGSLMILVDVSLELGDYATARRTLQQFRNKNSFAYLIREAKLKDHEGDLEGAISSMERAYHRIEGNKGLSQWALCNLADMYGHAGRISEAYQLYLETLKINPHDDYALKGIAWIAFSRDFNTTEAKRIINTLASRKKMPETNLLLAEIAAFENDGNEKLAQLKRFKSFVSQPAYKNMYHKYLATIEAEDFDNADESIAIAKMEIENRPTPQSFDLLAWGLYHQGNFSQALEIARQKVEGHTFEPEAYYHIGRIYLANGNYLKSKQYLEEALKSEFELGPTITREIIESLNTL